MTDRLTDQPTARLGHREVSLPIDVSWKGYEESEDNEKQDV